MNYQKEWVDEVIDAFQIKNIQLYSIRYSENYITVHFNDKQLKLNTNKEFYCSSRLKNEKTIFDFIEDNIPKNCFHNTKRFVFSKNDLHLPSKIHCIKCGKSFPAVPMLNKLLDEMDKNETKYNDFC